MKNHYSFCNQISLPPQSSSTKVSKTNLFKIKKPTHFLSQAVTTIPFLLTGFFGGNPKTYFRSTSSGAAFAFASTFTSFHVTFHGYKGSKVQNFINPKNFIASSTSCLFFANNKNLDITGRYFTHQQRRKDNKSDKRRIQSGEERQAIRMSIGTASNESSSKANNSISEEKDIDGKAIAAQIRSEIKARVSSLSSTPGLAVILVGSRRDSQTYVRMKKRACEEVGIASFGFDYPDTVTEEELLDKIIELNNDEQVHGILVQLPLPSHINENNIIEAVHPTKDVDGLHPRNTASLCATGTHVGAEKIDWTDMSTVPFHIPCTPQGCIELLDRSGVEIKGKNVVVVGRSNLVGLPVAMLLMHRDATVTIVHSKTVDAPNIVNKADIVVAAIGRSEMVKKEWIKDGCVVIDVGINSVDDPNSKKGYKLVGDVHYAGVKDVASKITPVPGGVGPMTIAMLLRNTVNSCIRSSPTSHS